MKQIIFSLTFAVLAPHLFADDWTGHWVMQPPGAQTTPAPAQPSRTISLWLKADGPRLTGYISGRSSETLISEGKIEGDHLSFVIVTDYFGEERRANYSGVLAKPELRITLPAMGGRGAGGDTHAGRHRRSSAPASRATQNQPASSQRRAV